MSRTLLRNALIVPVIGAPAYGSLLIEDGAIAAVGDVAPGGFDGDVVDCNGSIVLPGLINAHLHPELHVLKGIVEEMDLHAWDEAEHLEPALVYLGSHAGRAVQEVAIRASITDCLLGGTTCIATYGVTLGSTETAAAILDEIGVRGWVTIRDAAFEPVSADAYARPAMYRLHAEEALSATELAAAAEAHARGERIVMHAAETEHRLRLVFEQFGTSTIRLLDRWKLLSERTLLSHAVHVDSEEIDLLAHHRAAVVSSPTAEMKLSDGLAPVVDFIHAGVPVALGTDCAICNNSDDMFLEMRQLGLSQKLRYGAHAISAEQILLAATLNGARALGMDQQTGALTPGRRADLVVIAVDNPRVQPLVTDGRFSNVAANLVYATTGQDVTAVMIDGEWLVRDRVPLHLDARRLWQDLRGAAHELYEQILK